MNSPVDVIHAKSYLVNGNKYQEQDHNLQAVEFIRESQRGGKGGFCMRCFRPLESISLRCFGIILGQTEIFVDNRRGTCELPFLNYKIGGRAGGFDVRSDSSKGQGSLWLIRDLQ
jgi:hypothetical protein